MLHKARVLTVLLVFAGCELAGYFSGARPTIVIVRGLIAMGVVWFLFGLGFELLRLLTYPDWSSSGQEEDSRQPGSKPGA